MHAPARAAVEVVTWARRAAAGAEDHPLLATAVVAAVARLVLATASFVAGGNLIPDEGQYIDLAAAVADGRGAEAWVASYGQSLYDSTFPFTAPLARLFDLFGPVRLVGQLWAAAFGVAVAIGVTKLALEVLPRRWAAGIGLAAAVWPSQVLFSSVVMRESMAWACLVVVAVAVAVAGRSTGLRLLLPAAAAAGALAVLGNLRDQTMAAAAWALALAVPFVARRQRLLRSAGAFAIALLIPTWVGLGPFAYELVQVAVPRLGTTRTNMAIQAESAFTPTTVVTTAPDGSTGPTTTRPPAAGGGGGGGTTTTTEAPAAPQIGRRRGMAIVQAADGTVYEIDETALASVKHLPRGLVATILRPFPWDRMSSLSVWVAALENIAWYALYVLALVGLVVHRACTRVVLFPFLSTGFLLGIAALSQGNLGTAFRHRGQVLWAILLLAGLGLHALVERRRRTAKPDEPAADAREAVGATA